MDQYSFFADLLDKFHTASDWIQMLWIFSVPATIVGVAWCLKEAIVTMTSRRRLPRGELVYSIVRNHDNEFLVYRHGSSEKDGQDHDLLRLSTSEPPSETPRFF